MFDTAKAREKIERRNRLRAEVHLPPLSMANELRKLFNAERKHDSAEREAEFESFFNTSPLRKRVEARLLARHRRLRQDPEWRPTGFLSGGGWPFYACTRKVMGRIWLRRSQSPKSAPNKNEL
jgi:hypothetical protein